MPGGQRRGGNRRGCRHQIAGCREPGDKKHWAGAGQAPRTLPCLPPARMGALGSGWVSQQLDTPCPPSTWRDWSWVCRPDCTPSFLVSLCLSMLGTAQGQFLSLWVGVGMCVVLRDTGVGEGAQDQVTGADAACLSHRTSGTPCAGRSPSSPLGRWRGCGWACPWG